MFCLQNRCFSRLICFVKVWSHTNQKVPRNLGASKKNHALGFGPSLGAERKSRCCRHVAEHGFECSSSIFWSEMCVRKDGGRSSWQLAMTILLISVTVTCQPDKNAHNAALCEKTVNALWHVNVAANMRLQQIVRPNWSIDELVANVINILNCDSQMS